MFDHPGAMQRRKLELKDRHGCVPQHECRSMHDGLRESDNFKMCVRTCISLSLSLSLSVRAWVPTGLWNAHSKTQTESGPERRAFRKSGREDWGREDGERRPLKKPNHENKY